MPIKDFLCLNCTKEFDRFKKQKNPDPLTECPHCGSVATVELHVIGRANFHLVGDAWESKSGY